MRDATATGYAIGLIAGIDNSGSFTPRGRTNQAQTVVIYVRLKDVIIVPHILYRFQEETDKEYAKFAF